MGRVEKAPIAFATAAAAAAALATETINYTYDARGRLIKVDRSGTVNNGVNTSYVYDKADNRTNNDDHGKMIVAVATR